LLIRQDIVKPVVLCGYLEIFDWGFGIFLGTKAIGITAARFL
jgi:hypothetical protein